MRRRSRGSVVGLAALLIGTTMATPGAFAADEPGSPAQARSSQWWLDTLGVTKAQTVTRGEGATVCLVDLGFLPTAPDLVGADFSVGSDLTGTGVITKPTPFDTDHGTQMASLIVGQGSGPNRAQGTLGVAPRATVRWVSVANQGTPTMSDALKACADLGADVISASIAATVPPEAIAYAQARDAVIVAPTGNESVHNGISDFAARWGVVAVTGVDATLTFDPRANTGPATFPLRDLDPNPRPEDAAGTVVAAPYSMVASTDEKCRGSFLPDVAGGYVNTCGTSNGTAIVAGIVALIRSKYPQLNAANVVNRLIRTARPMGATSVPSPPLGFGIVDAYAALTADVPTVDANPLGSCYTGSRGLWDERVKPTRPEPPVNVTLAPASWRDPIPDVPPATTPTTGAGSPGSTGPSTAGPAVASGPVASSGVPTLVWLGVGLVLVLSAGGLAVAVAASRRRRGSTSSG